MDKKSVFEIVLMPLVVAVIGVIGTMLVTRTQIESSNTVAKAQQKIKIIEIFSNKITANDKSQRTLAIKVLAAIDPDLGEKIASAIAGTNLDVKRNIDGMESSLALEVKAELKKDIAQNAKYLVGFYGYNVASKDFQKALMSMKDSGYTIVKEKLLTTRPDWLASDSTVLYYSKDSRIKADNVAKQLSSVTKTKFSIRRGAGLGVPEGQESQRLFIHFLK